MLLFLSLIFAYNHNKFLLQNSTWKFCFELESEGSQLTADISFTNSENVFFSVSGPVNIARVQLTDRNRVNKFLKPGIYNFEVINLDSKQALITVKGYTDAYKPDEDHIYINKIMEKLRNGLNSILIENQKLKELKEINLRALRRDKKWMALSLFLPLIYIVIGFVSLNIQKSYFKPSNK